MILSAFWNASAMVEVPGESQRNSRGRSGKHDCADLRADDDPRSIFLTPNNNTPYTWFWLDLRNGPLVLQIPPKVLGLIDDMWYKFVTGSGMMVPAFGVVGGTPGWAVRRMIPIDSRFNLLMQTTDGVLV